MTPPDLRAIAGAATPGPWVTSEPRYEEADVLTATGRWIARDSEGLSMACREQDAAHIAAWSPDRALAALDVIEAGEAYADFTHGNIRGLPYRARREARDALQDAIERWDALA